MNDIIWTPSQDFIAQSNVQHFMNRHRLSNVSELVTRSTKDIAWFWDAALKDLGLEWFAPYHTLMDSSRGLPWTRWFLGGKINIAHNCVDRHAKHPERQSYTALIWEDESGRIERLTYRELGTMTNQVAGALTQLGVCKGDVVGMILPMRPETVATLLACCKIGAIALPIFSGFGPKAIAFRLAHTEAKVVVAVSATTRRGKTIDVHKLVTEALAGAPSLQHAIWIADEIPAGCPAHKAHLWKTKVGSQPMDYPTLHTDAEDPCLIMYTSGTTGNPKGTVHTHGGCLSQTTKELFFAFDVKPRDVFYWFTDIGWMMGPWEIIGACALGATVVLYEGTPDYPTPNRIWSMVERHHIRTLGMSPTAVRLLMKYGEQVVHDHAMPTLDILGSTGEIWDPDSYMWYFTHVGKKRCPIINISGGTEIIGCLLSPLPVMPLKPCTLGGPGLGMDVDICDDAGKPITTGIGHLVCKKPAPSMTKGFWKEPERYLQTYFSRWPNVWYHGDYASRDADGYWYLHGRSDDTIKIAGKRLGPGDFEAALMSHDAVAQAAAIGIPDPVKGETVVCFVVLKDQNPWDTKIETELHQAVVSHLGKSLAPKAIYPVADLPRTRSAKIVRSLMRQAYLGEPLGDTSSVENPGALEEIRKAR